MHVQCTRSQNLLSSNIKDKYQANICIYKTHFLNALIYISSLCFSIFTMQEPSLLIHAVIMRKFVVWTQLYLGILIATKKLLETRWWEEQGHGFFEGKIGFWNVLNCNLHSRVREHSYPVIIQLSTTETIKSICAFCKKKHVHHMQTKPTVT